MTNIINFSKKFKNFQKKLKRPLVFFDLETTGVSTKSDRIVEITMIKVTNSKVNDPIVVRMNPGIKIPQASSNVHGIFDDDVVDLDGFDKHGKKIAKVMNDVDYAGYNVKKFDIPLLQAEFKRHKIKCDLSKGQVIDPFIIFKSRTNQKLPAAVKYYTGHELENAHSSLADTVATLEVFSRQLEVHEDLPGTITELVEKQNHKKEIKHFILKDGNYHFNFGKHKGKSLSEEPGYLKWMLTAEKPFPEKVEKIIKEHLNQ